MTEQELIKEAQEHIHEDWCGKDEPLELCALCDYVATLVTKVRKATLDEAIEFISYDMNCDSEAQRKSVVEMYKQHFGIQEEKDKETDA